MHRVLIVEPDPMHAWIAQQHLATILNLEIVFVNDINQAAITLAATPVDLVITEWRGFGEAEAYMDKLLDMSSGAELWVYTVSISAFDRDTAHKYRISKYLVKKDLGKDLVEPLLERIKITQKEV